MLCSLCAFGFRCFQEQEQHPEAEPAVRWSQRGRAGAAKTARRLLSGLLAQIWEQRHDIRAAAQRGESAGTHRSEAAQRGVPAGAGRDEQARGGGDRTYAVASPTPRTRAHVVLVREAPAPRGGTACASVDLPGRW